MLGLQLFQISKVKQTMVLDFNIIRKYKSGLLVLRCKFSISWLYVLTTVNESDVMRTKDTFHRNLCAENSIQLRAEKQ